VYARFLLQHLSQPDGVLRRTWAAVAEGGVLLVEDADFDGWCCDPPNEGFELFLDAYQRVLARRGGDHATGRKLYRFFLAAGIPHPEIKLVQAAHQGEAKMLAWSTLDATAEAIISEGIATRTRSLPRWRACAGSPTIQTHSSAGHGSSSSGPGGNKARPRPTSSPSAGPGPPGWR
jgi:hypothetical protein